MHSARSLFFSLRAWARVTRAASMLARTDPPVHGDKVPQCTRVLARCLHARWKNEIYIAEQRHRCFWIIFLQPFLPSQTPALVAAALPQVKPLEFIWRRFPDFYDRRNTVHVDDLSRNFVLNPANGLKCTA